MANVVCPTCGHFYCIRNEQTDLVLVCPKCKLSFRALDSLITEQLQDATKFVAKAPPNSALVVGGVVITVGIVALIVVYSPASPRRTTTSQPTYTNEATPAYAPAPFQTPARTYEPAPTTVSRLGAVNYSMIKTLKDSWIKEGWRDKPRSEQTLALALMIGVVRNDIQDPADREATLDYIQETVGTW
jgi:hypothetical protein